jgi:hypothetical protein
VIFVLNIIVNIDSQNLIAANKSNELKTTSVDSAKLKDENTQHAEQPQQKIDRNMPIFPLDSASAAKAKGC